MSVTAVRKNQDPSLQGEKRSIGVPPEQGDTIVDALFANVSRYPDRPAMRRHPPDGPTSGEWEVVTWAEYLLAARRIAGGLAELGVEPGQRVAILSANRVEWHLADLGTLLNGSVTVPIYPTSSPSQIAYMLGYAKVEVCFVDTHAQLGKLVEVREELPDLKKIVLSDSASRAGDSFVLGFSDLLALGDDRLRRDPGAVNERSSQVRPSDLATIVYTSGTTGPPKGAMISHANIMWTVRTVTPVYGIGEGDRLLSFLPLSHIAERMMSDFMPIAVTGETWFARSLATVAEDLPSCRPTVFLAVPRVWEKLREGVEAHLRAQPVPVRAAAGRYVALGLQHVAARQDGTAQKMPAVAAFQALDRTLGASIRRHLGLDQAQVLIIAAAPRTPTSSAGSMRSGFPCSSSTARPRVAGRRRPTGPITSGSAPSELHCRE